MKCHSHPVCAASRRFGNCGHDCLGPRDFRRAVAAHGELLRVMVLPGAPCTTASRADRGPPCVRWQGRTTASRYQGTKFKKAAREKDAGPTSGFATSPEVGPGDIVGTLQTGYPRIQALSQDKGQDICSRVPTCPVPPALASWLMAALEPPHVSWLQSPPPSSGQLWGHHVSRGSSSRLLAQGSCGATMCHVAPAPAS
jgi:hypothetical protein